MQLGSGRHFPSYVIGDSKKPDSYRTFQAFKLKMPPRTAAASGAQGDFMSPIAKAACDESGDPGASSAGKHAIQTTPGLSPPAPDAVSLFS